jgi:hypothetical protein
LHVVASRDDLEEEVGIAVGVREIAHLVDAQKSRQRVAPHSAPECGGALLRREIREHVAGAGDADGVALHERVVSEVAEDHALAHAVGADEDRVGTVVEEAQAEEFLDALAFDPLRPRPVEVRDRLEGADAGVT